LQSYQAVRLVLSGAERSGEALDFCLSLGGFGGDTGGPIVELLLVQAYLAIRRRYACARCGAVVWLIAIFNRAGDEAECHAASIIGALSSA
jgi:hypothetical protein